jgi:hypothetical protein
MLFERSFSGGYKQDFFHIWKKYSGAVFAGIVKMSSVILDNLFMINYFHLANSLSMCS